MEEKSIQEERYIAGIRKYRDKGVRVLIDGKEQPENSWTRLFRHSEEGFYRCDHRTGADGMLREIQFNWVCHGNPK